MAASGAVKAYRMTQIDVQIDTKKKTKTIHFFQRLGINSLMNVGTLVVKDESIATDSFLKHKRDIETWLAQHGVELDTECPRHSTYAHPHQVGAR